MDFAVFLLLYVLVAVLSIGVLLFGNHCGRVGTNVQSFVQGGCCELLLARASPETQDRVLTAFEYAGVRCGRVLQIGYALLVALLYGLYRAHVFSLVPNNPAVSEGCVSLGNAAVFLSVLAFIASSFSDPGTVTAQNRKTHARLYPCDGVLWADKWCDTCKLWRPARSKHCRSCGCCVARFDHHCAWTNNCVGLGNTRFFLAFLCSNACMTGYGAALGVLTLWGELKRMGLLGHKVVNWHTGTIQTVYVLNWRALAHFTLVGYPTATALVIFLGLATVLLLAFLAYHLIHVLQGRTQYEADRWALHLEEQRAVQAAVHAVEGEQSGLKGTEAPADGAGGGAQPVSHARVGGADVFGDSAPLHPEEQASSDPGISTGGLSVSEEQRLVSEPASGLPPSESRGQGEGLKGRHTLSAKGARQTQRAQRQPGIGFYNRGALTNLNEILFPGSALRAASA